MIIERLKKYFITLITAIIVSSIIIGIYQIGFKENQYRQIKVGFIYPTDSSTAYTDNFVRSQILMQKKLGKKVKTYTKYNIPESNCAYAFENLIKEGCDLIFSTSYGYSETAKQFAAKNPDVQICQATGINANVYPVLKNYHTFMGKIHEGRYVSGVVAGLKIKELKEQNKIPKDETVKIGFVAPFTFEEIISGYTAFFLGIKSVVSDVKMTVKTINAWRDFNLERKYTKELIDEGCVIISYHSDTKAAAITCEETNSNQHVYLVAYNQSMSDIAPTTYLCGAKLNWTPYILSATEAVYYGKEIEKNVDAKCNGKDSFAGFDKKWVSMLELNKIEAAKNTEIIIEETIDNIKKGKIDIFKVDCIGVNVNNKEDIIDLKDGYEECKNQSAPSFNYILKDYITVE